MPRPSSGEYRFHGLSAKELTWLTADPREFNASFFEAQGLGITIDPDALKEIAMNIHWRDHGASYIVDELIGGPFDD